MNHLELIKRAFRISWRYRPLWIFGFLLALCGGGGGGGGGGGNIRFPAGQAEGDFGNLPDLPEIDPAAVILIIIGLVILILLLFLVGIVVRQVTRAALIGMVGRIQAAGAVTTGEGWRLGWSSRAWRLFLVSLLIGVPVALVSLTLFLAAFSPLLLLLIDNTALRVFGVVVTILAVLLVILFLIVIGVVITPLRELAWRRAVLDGQGALASLKETFALIKARLKDVAILWLLMFGVGLGWGILALIVVLPVSLLAALLVGGLPAALVYFMSESVLGAAITGIPLALIVLILVGSLATGLYLVFQSAVWTLAYLQIQGPKDGDREPATGDQGPGAGEPLETSPANPGDAVSMA